MAAKAGSRASRRSAAARSAPASTPRAYSAASSSSSGSALWSMRVAHCSRQALEFDHRPPDPAFHGAERHAHARRQVLIGVAVEERAAQRGALVRSPGRRGSRAAARDPARFPARCRRRARCRRPSAAASIGSMRRLCRLARSRSMARLRAIAISQVIGLARSGIEIGGFAPDRHIDLLQHVLGLAAFAQDTQGNAEKLRRGQAIDGLQRRRSPPGMRARAAAISLRGWRRGPSPAIRASRLRCPSGGRRNRPTTPAQLPPSAP